MKGLHTDFEFLHFQYTREETNLTGSLFMPRPLLLKNIMATAAEVPLVLVTGVSGFIGSHIAHQLLIKGQVRVRGTVRSLKNEEKVKPLHNLVPDAKNPLELVEAQLDNPSSWKEAVKGCSYVYHVASPVPLEFPRDKDEVIKPAVEGTLSVLEACAEYGGVKRIVLTSSIAAVIDETIDYDIDHVFTEKDWNNADNADQMYAMSKKLAEKAAWNFIDNQDGENKIELAVCNPVVVIGPLVSSTSRNATSLQFVQSPLARTYPFLLNLSFGLVDVRDVAAAHIAAMETPEAAGNRYILYSESLWHKEASDILAAEFSPQGYNVPTQVLPDAGAWVLTFFSKVIHRFYRNLGKMSKISNEKMKTELKIEPRDVRKSIVETGYSLIEHGVIPKAPGYLPPSVKPRTE